MLRAKDPLLEARALRGSFAPREVEPRLWEWVPTALVPWMWGARLGGRLGRSLPSLAMGLTGTLRSSGFASPDLLVIDHPLFCNLDHVTGAARFAYRATDIYREMYDRRLVDTMERRLIARADCVMATSQPVAQRMREFGAAHPILIENGAEVAAHDWSRIAQHVLATALSDRARGP